MYYFLVVLFVIFLFLSVTLLTGILAALGYLIFIYSARQFSKTKTLSRQIERRAKYSAITLTILFASYQTFTAFFPTDSFYFDEFREVTLREPPPTAKIIYKDSTYPDFHGDYSSKSVIRLSKNDYLNLFNEIIKDRRFTKEPRFKYLINNKKVNLGFSRQIEDKEDHYLNIIFLDDLESIVIQVAET